MLYPLHLQLRNRRCLIIGGGPVAERKAAGLGQAGGAVAVVSPRCTPTLHASAQSGEIEWLQESYQDKQLSGAFLVFACTDDRAVNAQVLRDAQARGLLTLVADDPETGDFVSPTVVRRGDLLLTASTQGNSPTLTAVIRERLEAEFGPEWAELTALIGDARGLLQNNRDEAARKAAVRRVLDDAQVRRLIQDGRQLEAGARVRECLSSSSE
jgi:precorrin-2 dehydrogenase/sirohydrochlorin ferrochelatase